MTDTAGQGAEQSRPEPSGPPSRDERFPKDFRLRTRREFLRVQDRGRKISVDPLLALVLPNGKAQTRIGLTVSSKVGNAVVRGRIRRQLREQFRKKRAQLPRGVDVVLVARQSARDADAAVFSRAFDRIAQKLRELFP